MINIQHWITFNWVRPKPLLAVLNPNMAQLDIPNRLLQKNRRLNPTMVTSNSIFPSSNNTSSSSSPSSSPSSSSRIRINLIHLVERSSNNHSNTLASSRPNNHHTEGVVVSNRRNSQRLEAVLHQLTGVLTSSHSNSEISSLPNQRKKSTKTDWSI